jgi:L-asparagine transporter-like permease
MALGLKVLAVFFAILFLAILILVLPSDLLNAQAFECLFNVGECMANGSAGLTTSKMIPAMSYYGTWQAIEGDGVF